MNKLDKVIFIISLIFFVILFVLLIPDFSKQVLVKDFVIAIFLEFIGQELFTLLKFYKYKSQLSKNDRYKLYSQLKKEFEDDIS